MECIELFERHTVASNHGVNINCPRTTRNNTSRCCVVAEVVAIEKTVVCIMETDVVHFEKVADGHITCRNVCNAVAGHTSVAPFFLESM